MKSEKAVFFERLSNYKKIAAVKDSKYIETVIKHKDKISAVFLMTGNILSVKQYVDLFKREGLPVFVHIEKIGGLSMNVEGLEFISHYVKPLGIVTTKPGLVVQAKKLKLMVIQRVFMIDTEVYNNIIESIEKNRADIIEIMPSRLPYLIQSISKQINKPLITGGLLSEKAHAKEAIESGAAAVTTSNIDVWKADLTDDVN
ncbi:MAG TPA: glycerol-3-phosphate responsive antiterminator [Metabacillus sp.]|nr:glycerol-3-phosphate responsive antiterminator [Metabacillus sp.]